jgi:hypothetical protein
MISAQGTGDSDRPATGEKDLQDLIWEVNDFGNILLIEEGMNGDDSILSVDNQPVAMGI